MNLDCKGARMKISRRKASATQPKDTTKEISAGTGQMTYRRIAVSVEREILSIRVRTAVEDAAVEHTDGGSA